MADDGKPAAPKARTKPNSVAIDDKERARKAGPAVQASEPLPGKVAIPDERVVETAKKPKTPSVEAGDLPEAVRRRYYADKAKWSGEPAFFTSAEMKDPAFRDQGRRLVTATESQEVVKDLVAIAQHRGWEKIHVTGTEAFRRSVWLEAAQKGLEIKGYKPNDRDLQELDRLRSDGSKNTISPASGRDAGDARSPTPARSSNDPGSSARQTDGLAEGRSLPNDRAADSQMRVMEAVIRRTLFDDPEAVLRVMTVARAQLDAHIAAGRTIRPAVVRDSDRAKRVEVAGPAASARTGPERAGREPKPQERVRSR